MFLLFLLDTGALVFPERRVIVMQLLQLDIDCGGHHSCWQKKRTLFTVARCCAVGFVVEKMRREKTCLPRH